MRLVLALGLALATVACASSSGGTGDDDPTGDGGTGNGDGGGSDDPDGGVNNNPGFCSDPERLIYTLEANKRVSKFNPATGEFTQIGYIACPGSSAFFNPFSMAIDRDSIMWVLYKHQNDPNTAPALFAADSNNNLECNTTTWTPQGGVKLFSMGYSTDVNGGMDDTMFIVGGTDVTNSTQPLATLETSTMVATGAGSVNTWVELSGNAKGELWAFAPLTTPPQFRRVNKTTGATEETINSSGLPSGSAEAWAFAWWGGDFWVFYKRGADMATIIYQMDGVTGAVKSSINTYSVGIPRVVVGAAVSTCAPVILL